MLRSPILVLLGHVDHGKTSLADKIRGTKVASGESGLITQHVGCSYVPSDTIKTLCKDLLEKFKINITIPGLLFIDTPGHEAFTTLRKRGGSVADLAILVIDINEGLKPQTIESIEYLKQFKTPFMIAATKIDLIPRWNPKQNECFSKSFAEQNKDVQKELDDKLYTLIGQLSEKGFQSERFDRISDFKKQIVIVPCSGKTGEGIAELLVMLAGLAQQFLKDRLEISEKSRGTVLEIKEVRGFGKTIDVIIYDGKVKQGDYLVIGGEKPLVAKIKALLRPPILKELRVEKKFENVKEVNAAAGIKISAPGLENVISGSPIIFVSDESQIEQAKKEVQAEVEEVKFEKDVEGVIAKADTLGSLEALIKMLQEKNIPIKKAEIGNVNKQDIVEVDANKDDLRRSIIGFNVSILPDAEQLAKDRKIKLFMNDIIYRLLEDYEKWCTEKTEREKKEKLEKVIRPCKIKLLPGFVFRKNDPAIVGVEVSAGVIKPNTPLKNEKGKDVGKVLKIEKEGKTVLSAKTGDKVAVSIEGPTVGRQIKEGDILISVITNYTLNELKKIQDKLHDDEKQLLKEWELM